MYIAQAAPWYLWVIIGFISVAAFWYYSRKQD
jgi:hypothetical protein